MLCVFGGDDEDDVIRMMQKCQGLFFSRSADDGNSGSGCLTGGRDCMMSLHKRTWQAMTFEAVSQRTAGTAEIQPIMRQRINLAL